MAEHKENTFYHNVIILREQRLTNKRENPLIPVLLFLELEAIDYHLYLVTMGQKELLKQKFE